MAVKISIIIPTFKREEYMLNAVKSVLSQSYKNIEIIVVDDDPKSTISERFSIFQNSKIRYFRNNTNRGSCFSRNFGVETSKGEYISFLDDDDFWTPDKLQKQLEHFQYIGPEFGVVYCGYDFVIKDEVIKRNNPYYSETDVSKISLNKCPIGSPTALIRKSFFLKAGRFDESLPSCQDWDIWIRLSKICRFSPIRESLAFYRIHGNQISTDISKKIAGRKIILKKYYNDLIDHPTILSWHYRRLGTLYSLNNQKNHAMRYYKKSIIKDHFNWGSWFHFLCLFLNRKLHKLLIIKYGIKNIKGIHIID